MKRIVQILPILFFLMPGLLINAETVPDLDLEQLLAGKRKLVKETLQLTEKESAVFWPLYDDYEKNMVYIFNRYDEQTGN